MKLSEIKDKRDYIIFRCLLRCIKEIGYSNCNLLKTNFVFGGINGKRPIFENVIEECYRSRKNHPGEDIFTNVTYWPYDLGDLFRGSLFNSVMFMARVINAVDCKISKIAIERFKSVIRSLVDDSWYGLKNSNYLNCTEACLDELKNAMTKCGLDKEKMDEYLLIIKGRLNSIPF